MNDAITKYINQREKTEAKLYARIQKLEARQASVDEALRCLMRLLPDIDGKTDKNPESEYLKVYDTPGEFKAQCIFEQNDQCTRTAQSIRVEDHLPCIPDPENCPRLRPKSEVK